MEKGRSCPNRDMKLDPSVLLGLTVIYCKYSVTITTIWNILWKWLHLVKKLL
jgi:hypothetical protein